MKILLVSGVYPPEIGGPSEQTRDIALGLRARGFDVAVVTYGHCDRRARPADGIRMLYVNGDRAPGLLAKATRHVRLYRRIRQIVEAERPDVIHMQTASGPLALCTGIVARLQRIPSLLKYSSDFWREALYRDRLVPADGWAVPGFRGSALALIQAVMLRTYRCVWVTSHSYSNTARRHYRIPRERVVLLPNFRDLRHLRVAGGTSGPAVATEPRPLRILSVSRLRPIKGIETILRALAELRDLPVTFRIAGNGSVEYERWLRDLCGRLDLNDRVTFLGAIPSTRVVQELSAADLFVLASHSEAFSVAILEALSARVPVIATRVGGIPELIEDGVSGLLVERGDSTAMAGAIRRLASDEALHQRLAVTGQAVAQRFDIDDGLDRLIAVYDKLIGGRALPEPDLVRRNRGVQPATMPNREGRRRYQRA